MIVVTLQTLDGTDAYRNGLCAIQFYNLSEAESFAREESTENSSLSNSQGWSKVYNDGTKVAEYINGTAQ